MIPPATWQEISKTSQHLENPSFDLKTAVKLLESLKKFVLDLWERFDDYEEIGI